MLLHVKGSNRKVRKAVEQAAWYYAEALMGKRLLGSLEITINLRKDLMAKEGIEGSAIWEDEDGHRPREFNIELDTTVKIRNLLITLAHEMVHVKQWAKNEMYEYVEQDMVRFNKTKFNMSDINYWDYPWEIEAFGRQLGLFVRFCEHMGFEKDDNMKEEA
jgi:hypothetical protein